MEYVYRRLNIYNYDDKQLVKQHIRTIDMILFYFIISNLFLLRFIKVNYELFYILDFFLLIYSLIHLRNIRFNISFVGYTSFLVLLMIIGSNIEKFGFNENVINNLLMIYTPLCYFAYFSYLKKTYSLDVLEKLYSVCFYLLNIHFVINTIIIFIQIKTTSFLIGRFLAGNPHPFDHWTGLVGMNGVSVLNFLWIVTVLFNMYKIKKTKSQLMIVWLAVQFSIMGYLSIAIDNKMLIQTLLIFVFIFFLINFLTSDKFVITKITLLTLLFISIAFVGITFSNSQYEYVSEDTFISNFIYDPNSVPSPHNERAYLNYLAYYKFDASSQGIGFSNVNLNNQTIHVHLGINSSSLLLILGGLFFLGFTIHIYTLVLYKCIEIKGGRIKKIIIYLSLLITITTCAYATQIFRDQYITIALFLITFIFYLTSNKKETNTA
ncbi:hypothetical protein [Paenibacillus sp. PDC88]|uniref:hypothetical protein n=1 Tax=Paenibacillus sp. PDC88 TaxID=1884375 RepID=UPI00089CA7E0|nr:hypothetical protein [Paenibacillus sp. PDC88]SDX31223.1 hypothetical protein SAMN05518848_106141 [Paenibacillus sp. PDC88]